MLPEPILLSRAQIDVRIWDHHIHDSRQCVIYALSWYLDTVCEDWGALVWPNASEPEIVMPLPLRRKISLQVIEQPLFCQYLGIFSKDALTAAQCECFLRALKMHFRYISRYAFNPDNQSVGDSGFQWDVMHTHWLRLDGDLHYSRDRRKNIKRALKWEITASRDIEPLMDLFKQNHAARIGKIHPGAYQIFTKLVEQCLQRGLGTLWYAGSHAGIFLTHYRGRTIYLFNAADATGRKGNARAVMLDRWFRTNTGVFDFESPAEERIAGYYQGFGAAAMPFYSIRRNALPWPLRQIQRWRLTRTS